MLLRFAIRVRCSFSVRPTRNKMPRNKFRGSGKPPSRRRETQPRYWFVFFTLCRCDTGLFPASEFIPWRRLIKQGESAVFTNLF